MDAGFVDDLVAISRPNHPVFPVFFPVIRKFEFGDWFESDCILSQPVRSPEISPTMSLGSPPFAGFLPLAMSLRVPNCHLFDSLCRKSPRIFGTVAVFWRNTPETEFDSTVWPGCQLWQRIFTSLAWELSMVAVLGWQL